MNLVADEGVDGSIVAGLRDEGHDVLYIAEEERGVSDDWILDQANARGAILLTQDKDFGDLVYRLGRVHAGVVLIRLEGLSSATKATLAAEAFRNHGGEMLGAFSVISPGRVRIRQRAVEGNS